MRFALSEGTAVALAYTIDEDEGVITIRGEYASPEEWEELLGGLRRDARWRPGLAILRDLRTARTAVNAATVVGIVEVIRRLWPLVQPSRLAILTPHDTDTYALVAHASADLRDIPLRAFTFYDEALAWLRSG